MERCEKIPAETYESRNRSNVEEEPRLWPRVDREGKALGDAEYVVPSPPEREQQSQTLSHVDLEAYVRGYQDPQVPQVRGIQPSNISRINIPRMQREKNTQCLTAADIISSCCDFKFIHLGGPLSRNHLNASGS